MKPELQAIVDEMEFDNDEDRNGFIAYLEKDKIGAKIAAGYMKNKDYTTKTAAVAEAKRQLEAQQEEFNQGQEYLTQQMGTYKADMEARLNTTLRELSEARLYGAALKTKVDTLAAQYGEDPADLLKDVKEMREEKKTTASTFDDEELNKRYPTRDEFTQANNGAYAFAPMIRDFERDYAKTFGHEYEGSITELFTSASQEVRKLQERGQQVNMFDHLRTKLDFAGQQQRNAETAKAAAEKEREDWKTQTREEIERDVRSKVLAENPNALKSGVQWEREQWRDNLGAKARQNQAPQQTPQDQFAARQSLHQKFIENAEKAGASV